MSTTTHQTTINTVYLAGPMRGHHRFNVEAFDIAANELRAQNYTVISPVDMERDAGGDRWFAPGTIDPTPEELSIMLRRDLLAIFDRAEAVVVLPGWDRSIGARLEVQTARALSLPVLEYPSLDDVDASILAEAERLTSGARNIDYGNPEDDFGRIAALWNAYQEGRGNKAFEPADVAKMMILLKIARASHAKKRDNYVDIAGYARCGARCEGLDGPPRD